MPTHIVIGEHALDFTVTFGTLEYWVNIDQREDGTYSASLYCIDNGNDRGLADLNESFKSIMFAAQAAMANIIWNRALRSGQAI